MDSVKRKILLISIFFGLVLVSLVFAQKENLPPEVVESIDFSECEAIGPDDGNMGTFQSKRECYFAIGEEIGKSGIDITRCSEIGEHHLWGAEYEGNCYDQAALHYFIKTGNSSICDQIPYDSVRIECELHQYDRRDQYIYRQAWEDGTGEKCQQITEVYRKSDCYEHAVREGADISLCDNVNEVVQYRCKLGSRKELNSFWILQAFKVCLIVLVYSSTFILFNSKMLRTSPQKGRRWDAISYQKKGFFTGVLVGGFCAMIFESARIIGFFKYSQLIIFRIVPFAAHYLMLVVYGLGEGVLKSDIFMMIFGSPIIALLLLGAWGAFFGRFYGKLKREGQSPKTIIIVILVVYIISTIITLFTIPAS